MEPKNLFPSLSRAVFVFVLYLDVGDYIVSKCKLQFSCQNYIFFSLFEEKSFDESDRDPDPDPDPDVK